MTNEVKRIVQWLRIIGTTKDGCAIYAPITEKVVGARWTCIQRIVVPAADLIEKLATENEELRSTRDALSAGYGRMMARCEAAERDLNSLLRLCGLQCYEACRFCAMPDDETCIAGAPKGRCNAVWRGLRKESGGEKND